MIARKSWFGVAAIAAALFCANCRRTDPLDSVVGAATTLSFQQWRARAVADLTREQANDFDTAVQELKFKLMGDGYSGSDAIDEAFRNLVAGKTVRQVVELGLSAKVQRLEQQRIDLDRFIAQNKQLKIRESDDASAAYLQRKEGDQVARRDTIDRDLAATRERMKAFGLTPPPSVEDHPDVAPERAH